MSTFLRPFVWARSRTVAKEQTEAISKRLRRYGLLYDDLYDPSDSDVKEALSRLPREVVDARNQRLRAAIDLRLKGEYLPEHIQPQEVEAPFRGYLKNMLYLVQRERAERESCKPLPLDWCPDLGNGRGGAHADVWWLELGR